MQVYGVGFCHGTRFFEKTGFRQKVKFRKKTIRAKKLIFLKFWRYAIQTNLGTKELLEKTVLENMDYWQNGLQIEKKVCDFQVPVGRLGLKLGPQHAISEYCFFLTKRFAGIRGSLWFSALCDLPSKKFSLGFLKASSWRKIVFESYAYPFVYLVSFGTVKLMKF